ncbi:hypothetical protein G9A89_001928 [Geosiphon pyriformis]|nr:hypothetical protein G9A89_001928 [Geosiphon pyriformis]
MSLTIEPTAKMGDCIKMLFNTEKLSLCKTSHLLQAKEILLNQYYWPSVDESILPIV